MYQLSPAHIPPSHNPFLLAEGRAACHAFQVRSRLFYGASGLFECVEPSFAHQVAKRQKPVRPGVREQFVASARVVQRPPGPAVLKRVQALPAVNVPCSNSRAEQA